MTTRRSQDAAYTGAVEGPTDEVALRRVSEEAGVDLSTVYVTNGKSNLMRRLPGFNEAARHAPWIVLVDLNGVECPPALIGTVMPSVALYMRCRVVVRALEAWLLADSEHLAEFLGVSSRLVPNAPETLPNPKLELVNLAARSRKRAIRDDMVPTGRSGRLVGPNYEGRLIEFMTAADPHWSPRTASLNSDSLARCLGSLT